VILRRMFRDTFVYGLSGVVSRFIGFLLVPIYTRMLAPADFGLLDLLTIASSIMVLLGGMQVESGIARGYYEARKAGTLATLVGTGIRLYTLGVAVVGVLGLAAFQFWFVGRGGLTWREAAPLFVGLLPSQWLVLWLLLLRYEGRPYQYAVMALGDVLCTTAFSVTGVCVLRLGVRGILWGMALSKILWATVGLVTRFSGSFRGWSRAEAGRILVYSVPTVPNTLVNWIQNYGNRFILLGALSLAGVGVYGLANRLASPLMVAIWALRLAWDPLATELIGKPEAPGVYARALDAYLLGMTLACGLLGALGDLFVRVLAPASYAEAGRLVAGIAMANLWLGSLQVLMMGMNVVRQTYWGVIAFVAGLAANLLPLWLWIGAGGLPTAAWTLLAGSLVTAEIALALSQRCFRIPYHYGVLRGSMAFSILASILFSAWPGLVPAGLGGAADTLLRLAAAGAGWYLLVYLFVPREMRAELVRRVRHRLWKTA